MTAKRNQCRSFSTVHPDNCSDLLHFRFFHTNRRIRMAVRKLTFTRSNNRWNTSHFYSSHRPRTANHYEHACNSHAPLQLSPDHFSCFVSFYAGWLSHTAERPICLHTFSNSYISAPVHIESHLFLRLFCTECSNIVGILSLSVRFCLAADCTIQSSSKLQNDIRCKWKSIGRLRPIGLSTRHFLAPICLTPIWHSMDMHSAGVFSFGGIFMSFLEDALALGSWNSI